MRTETKITLPILHVMAIPGYVKPKPVERWEKIQCGGISGPVLEHHVLVEIEEQQQEWYADIAELQAAQKSDYVLVVTPEGREFGALLRGFQTEGKLYRVTVLDLKLEYVPDCLPDSAGNMSQAHRTEPKAEESHA
jgi:hypothetical protein